jgi:hypothetical protein
MKSALRLLRQSVSLGLLLSAAVAGLAGTARAQHGGLPAGLPQYYLGVDSQATVNYRQNASDTAITRPNPNQGRLTFLYAHTYISTPESNHYHSIGAYSYTGPTANPTVQDTSAGNRIPEVYMQAAGYPRLNLIPGTGANAGRYISGLDFPNTYEGLKAGSTQLLNAPGAPPTDGRIILFNSSGGRWNTSLAGAQIGIQLVDITPGLNIWDSTTNAPMFAGVGSIYSLGLGNAAAFNPLFWADGAVPLGTNLGATFRLVDTRPTGTPFGESGRFGYDFTTAASAAPEPGTLGLMLLGGAVIAGRRRRTRRAA